MADGILNTAGDISSILAAIEAGRAKGRIAQGDAQQRQALAAANIYRTQSDNALKGPLQSAKAAAQGDQMANIQPFSWTGGTSMSGNIPIPQSTGGLTPANFGPNTRRAGADLSALSADRVSSPAFNMPAAPILPPLPESNGLDSILGSASGIGSLLSALGKGGASSGGDLGKAASFIKNLFTHGGATDNGYGYDANQNRGPFDDPTTDNGYGYDPNQNRGDNPSVDTSTEFKGVPGGYPGNPEDPMSADPEWWRQFMGDTSAGGMDDGSGYGDGANDVWGG